MSRVPREARPLIGRWRIVEMEVWDKDYLDLVEPAFIAFDDEMLGAFVFGTVRGWLDVRVVTRDGVPAAEFSWQGVSDSDDACGRGWAMIDDQGRLQGRLFIHCSDDSAFTATRGRLEEPASSRFFEASKCIQRRQGASSIPAGLLNVRIHDLRHSFPSGAVAIGENLPMISKLLGNTQVQTTARYAHLAADPVQAAAERVSISLSELLAAAHKRAFLLRIQDAGHRG